MSDDVRVPHQQCLCGHECTATARFCPSCGSALGGGSVLLGASTEEVAGVDPGIDRRWMAVAGLLFAAVIGWSVWSGGSSESLANDDSAGTTSSAPTTSTSAPTTTTRPRPTSAPSTTAPIDGIATLVGDGSPLVGEPTGLRLLIGSDSKQPSVLELDTGRLYTNERKSWFQPLVVSGAWLVGRSNERLVSLPLDDLGAEPVELLSGEPGIWHLADPSPRRDGTLWVRGYREDGSELVRLDAATGGAIERYADDLGTGSNQYWQLPPTDALPALIDPLGGGIYEIDGDDYREVADGHLVAVDDRRVLVETCDRNLRCIQRWFDRAKWEPLDLAVPEGEPDSVMFAAGTDWLVLRWYTSDGAPATLLNVADGRTRDVAPNQFDPYSAFTPPISPDGRWLATVAGRDLAIIDLEAGTETLIEGVNVSYSMMLFTDAEAGIQPPLATGEDAEE